jgi:hypothetical protein
MTIDTPILTADQILALDAWLRSVLWDSKLPFVESSTSGDDSKYEIHRLKARLPLSNGEVKIVQGVRDIFEILDAPNSSSGKESGGKIVLIGKSLNEYPFQESFLASMKN